MLRMVRNAMAEYIEREAFSKDIAERYCLPCKEAGRDNNGCRCDVCWVGDIYGDVIDAPAADVEPVVHGRWEWLGPNRLVTDCMCGTCSACKVRSKYIVNTMLCPNCGAKMDGGDGNSDMA